MDLNRDSELTASIFTNLSEIETLAFEWRKLEQQSTAPLTWFQSYDWCSNWLRLHRSLYSEAIVITLRQKNTLVAVCPFMITTGAFGIRTLRCLGEPHSQYNNILSLTGTLTEAELSLLRRVISSIPKIDRAAFTLVPSASPLLHCFGLRAEHVATSNSSAFLDLKQFQSPPDYDKSLSKSTRRGRNRRRRLLEELGELRFRVLRPGEQDYDSLVRKSLRFKAVWLKRSGRAGIGIRAKNHDAFLTSLPRLEGCDGPLLFVLELNGDPIAIEIGFLRHGHFYAYIGSFNWSYYDFSPGKVLMENVIHWLIEQGARAYDLLANPTDYKNSWTDTQIALHAVSVDFSKSGQTYSAIWSKTLEPMLKHGFERLPNRIRVGLVMLRDIELRFVV